MCRHEAWHTWLQMVGREELWVIRVTIGNARSLGAQVESKWVGELDSIQKKKDKADVSHC